jgi:lycopene cyclase domain-containing protein
MWKTVFLSILIVAVLFIIWDIDFTSRGVWGFNEAYHLNLLLFGLPLEEILFFICIPYACIFTHYAFIHFLPDVKLNSTLVKIISVVLLLFSISIIYIGYPNAYTTSAFLLFAVLIGYSMIFKDDILQRFYITFLIILLPFFLVNGILTGSFIQDQVVWYNDAENLGVRIGTIPFEDIFYAFDMLYLNVILVEKLNLRMARKQTGV